MSNVYKGEFAEGNYEGRVGWDAVRAEFATNESEPEEVVLANYGTGSYEGWANVLYRNGESYFYVEGSHCSCMGLEGQFEPEIYDLPTLVGALEREVSSEYKYEYSFMGGYAEEVLEKLKTRL